MSDFSSLLLNEYPSLRCLLEARFIARDQIEYLGEAIVSHKNDQDEFVDSGYRIFTLRAVGVELEIYGRGKTGPLAIIQERNM